MSNHFSWETVAAIQQITSSLGHATKSHRPIADRLTLRCPRSHSVGSKRPTRNAASLTQSISHFDTVLSVHPIGGFPRNGIRSQALPSKRTMSS
ncbi:hypothetical protein FHX12_005993 [Rhizobium sp. BK609]|nr:hypothetical protein [Rhizobium sp. BK098]MBB3618963.1 hypothetical protein [Rhizobium sp. BK609]MBB3684625.1 hypothetical protein [Rhizobium sp. BK612]